MSRQGGLCVGQRTAEEGIVILTEALLLYPGAPVELLGSHQSIDDVAADAGTISYEILTQLGHRYAREYHAAQAIEQKRSMTA